MAGSEVPAIDGPAGQGRNQGAADGAVVVLRSDGRGPFAKTEAGAIRHRRACDRGEGSGAARRPKAASGPAAVEFTRGLRAIAAFRRCRPRTGR